jgi:hypothetical protein
VPGDETGSLFERQGGVHPPQGRRSPKKSRYFGNQ